MREGEDGTVTFGPGSRGCHNPDRPWAFARRDEQLVCGRSKRLFFRRAGRDQLRIAKISSTQREIAAAPHSSYCRE